MRKAHKQLTSLIALFISHCAHIQTLFVIYINFTSAVACFPMFGHNGPLEAPGSQMSLVTLAQSIIVLALSSAKGCIISALSKSVLWESFFFFKYPLNDNESLYRHHTCTGFINRFISFYNWTRDHLPLLSFPGPARF